MAGQPYWYVVDYEPDLDEVLEKLREREFTAGRYNPVMPDIDFPITPRSPKPGAWHESIDEAREASDADGTRSILDIDRIGEEPDFCTACPLDDSFLMDLFGTTQPTRAQAEDQMELLLEHVERGHAIYVVLYDKGKPREVMFAGYSFD